MRLIAAILVFLVLLVPSAQAEKRVALVVGNGAYSSVPALANPSADAEAFGAALQRLGFEVELGIDLDLQGMRRAVQAFSRQLEGADVALFFYAGHGIQVYGQNYLLPVDAALETEADLDFAAIPARLVLSQMERWPGVKIVVLDACRDNPFSSALSRTMGASRAARALSRGLAPIETAGGTLLAYATDPGDVAADGDGRHSPFTEALLKHVETPGLEINTMLARVRAEVFTSTRQRQRPWTETSLIGEFYMSPKEPEPSVTQAMMAPKSPQPPAMDPRQIELALWEAVQAGGTAEDYREYLRQYPEGIFARLARNRLAALERAAANPGAGGAGRAEADGPGKTPPGQGRDGEEGIAAAPPAEPLARHDRQGGGASEALALEEDAQVESTESGSSQPSRSEAGPAAPAGSPEGAAEAVAPTEPGIASAGEPSSGPDDLEADKLAMLPQTGTSPDPKALAADAETALRLSPAARRAVQARLMLAGHDPRGIDGIFGPGTRAALAAWQEASRLPATGYLDAEALARLERSTESEYAAWTERQRREAEARQAAERARAARRQTESQSTAVRAAQPVAPAPVFQPPVVQHVPQTAPSPPAPAAVEAPKSSESVRERYEQDCYFVFVGKPQLERRCK